MSGFGYILDAQSHVAYKYVLRAEPPLQPPVANSNKTTGQSAVKVVAPPPDSTRPTATEESLGMQTIEGVSVEGMKQTEVIPTGAQGNDRPMTIVSEIWSSPDLKVIILNKRTDPRFGEQTTRLTSIDASVPSPLLFQPPPDYKTVEETERVIITYKRPRFSRAEEKGAPTDRRARSECAAILAQDAGQVGSPLVPLSAPFS